MPKEEITLSPAVYNELNIRSKKREKDILKMTREVDHWEAKCATLEEELARLENSDKDIQVLKEQNEAKNMEITQLTEQIAQATAAKASYVSAQLDEMSTELKAKEKIIQDIQTEINQKDVTIKQLQKEIDEMITAQKMASKLAPAPKPAPAPAEEKDAFLDMTAVKTAMTTLYSDLKSALTAVEVSPLTELQGSYHDLVTFYGKDAPTFEEGNKILNAFLLTSPRLNMMSNQDKTEFISTILSTDITVSTSTPFGHIKSHSINPQVKIETPTSLFDVYCILFSKLVQTTPTTAATVTGSTPISTYFAPKPQQYKRIFQSIADLIQTYHNLNADNQTEIDIESILKIYNDFETASQQQLIDSYASYCQYYATEVDYWKEIAKRNGLTVYHTLLRIMVLEMLVKKLYSVISHLDHKTKQLTDGLLNILEQYSTYTGNDDVPRAIVTGLLQK